jgi:hypothetical protein
VLDRGFQDGREQKLRQKKGKKGAQEYENFTFFGGFQILFPPVVGNLGAFKA